MNSESYNYPNQAQWPSQPHQNLYSNFTYNEKFHAYTPQRVLNWNTPSEEIINVNNQYGYNNFPTHSNNFNAQYLNAEFGNETQHFETNSKYTYPNVCFQNQDFDIYQRNTWKNYFASNMYRGVVNTSSMYGSVESNKKENDQICNQMQGKIVEIDYF